MPFLVLVILRVTLANCCVVFFSLYKVVVTLLLFCMCMPNILIVGLKRMFWLSITLLPGNISPLEGLILLSSVFSGTHFRPFLYLWVELPTAYHTTTSTQINMEESTHLPELPTRQPSAFRYTPPMKNSTRWECATPFRRSKRPSWKPGKNDYWKPRLKEKYSKEPGTESTRSTYKGWQNFLLNNEPVSKFYLFPQKCILHTTREED